MGDAAGQETFSKATTERHKTSHDNLIVLSAF